jgi:hypothetical protein
LTSPHPPRIIWQTVDNEDSFRQGSVAVPGRRLKVDASRVHRVELQIDKITWTPNSDGSVRQLWESSTDHGKTWNIAFDGLYKKAK